MNEGLIFVAAILTLASAILAALYGIVRNAPPQELIQNASAPCLCGTQL
jgi:hypothetical protein